MTPRGSLTDCTALASRCSVEAMRGCGCPLGSGSQSASSEQICPGEEAALKDRGLLGIAFFVHLVMINKGIFS